MIELRLRGKIGALARRIGIGRPANAGALVADAIPEAQAGRKLAMFDRETGLLAYWYISLRVDEECYRSARYSRPMTLAVVEPAPSTNEWEVSAKINEWLAQKARRCDATGYAGNARYVIMMPETRIDAARKVTNRLRREVEGVQIGLSAFPTDGQSYEQLVAAGARRLDISAESAA